VRRSCAGGGVVRGVLFCVRCVAVVRDVLFCVRGVLFGVRGVLFGVRGVAVVRRLRPRGRCYDVI